MEEALTRIALELPGMGLLTAVFIFVLNKLMDFFGKKIERAIDAMEKAVEAMDRHRRER